MKAKLALSLRAARQEESILRHKHILKSTSTGLLRVVPQRATPSSSLFSSNTEGQIDTATSSASTTLKSHLEADNDAYNYRLKQLTKYSKKVS